MKLASFTILLTFAIPSLTYSPDFSQSDSLTPRRPVPQIISERTPAEEIVYRKSIIVSRSSNQSSKHKCRTRKQKRTKRCKAKKAQKSCQAKHENESANNVAKPKKFVGVAKTVSKTTSSSFESQALAAHNHARAAFGAKPLTWDSHLASLAQTWADDCVFQHGGANGAGQNIAAGQSNIKAVVDSFMAEQSSYVVGVASHFTQVVWKSTTKLGCAVKTCHLSIFGTNSSPAPFYVCNYSPAGNIEGNGGAYFRANVQV